MPREVVIGTSDLSADAAAAAPTHDPQQQESQPEMPTLAAVEAHMQRLRFELCGDGHASSGYAARVHIASHELSRMQSIIDVLDQLRYCATEEGTTFVEYPSQLAETEAPEAVVACLYSGRPLLITQALSVVQPMLRHPQTAWELRRVVREAQQREHQCRADMNTGSGARCTRNREEKEEEEDEAAAAAALGNQNAIKVGVSDSVNSSGDPLLVLLACLMERHARSAPLLTEVFATATAVVQVALANVAREGVHDGDVVSRHVRPLVDSLYETPLIFLMETAMHRFAAVVQLQVHATAFFCALVDLPAFPSDDGLCDARLADDLDSGVAFESGGRNGEMQGNQEKASSMKATTTITAAAAEVVGSTFMADAIAHSDGVLEALRRAMQLHRQHLGLCRCVLHTWCVCAQLPSSRVSLLRHGVYGAALRQLNEVGPYTLDVFRISAEIVGYFIPLSDLLQRRSLLLTLRGLLQRRPQLEMIELVLALLVAMLSVVEKSSISRVSHGRSDGSRSVAPPLTHEGVSVDGAVANRDPYAMYAMCPQPPLLSSSTCVSTAGLFSCPAAVPAQSASVSSAHAVTRCTALQLSPLFWLPPSSSSSCTSCAAGGTGGQMARVESDTWRFMLQRCALPQLVSGVLSYFEMCEVEDERDAADVRRVCALAEAVLAYF